MSTTKTTETPQQELLAFHETHFDKLGDAITEVINAMQDCKASDPRMAQVWVRLNSSCKLLNTARMLMTSARFDDDLAWELKLAQADGYKWITADVKIED